MTDSHVRPTHRALDDAGVKFPPLEQALHAVEHPVIKKAQRLPVLSECGSTEPIKCVGDRLWLKCKTGTWRAAVTQLTDAEYDDGFSDYAARWWIGAAGQRQEGSPHDFYRSLKDETRRRGTTSHLLPQQIDLNRLVAEAVTQSVMSTQALVRDVIARSLRTGRQWTAEATGHRITASTMMRSGEAYLCIGAEGFVDPRMIAIILASVPGVPLDDWIPEPGEALGVIPSHGQIVYSTILPPESQSALLDACPAEGE